jgi:hypothetical protein
MSLECPDENSELDHIVITRRYRLFFRFAIHDPRTQASLTHERCTLRSYTLQLLTLEYLRTTPSGLSSRRLGPACLALHRISTACSALSTYALSRGRHAPCRLRSWGSSR